ncbi:serine protease [Nitzschia inconspicua]|uniref:Serine protease n=1 Tax=Nitzschia inconspicua TaxID=303405 RepID=A0A9K3LYH4_9STRA|nr:serine protease [Nitzschia inconspicua]
MHATISKAVALLSVMATPECRAIRSSGSITYRTFQDDELPSEIVAASLGEFPFFAQWGGCAATLIWEDILLTSAACGVLESDELLVGAYASMKEENDAVKRQVLKRRSHPDFDPTSFINNFMVMKLNQPVNTTSATILPYRELSDEAELVVVGFGSTAARIQVSKLDSGVFKHTVIDTSEVLRFGNDDGPMIRMNDAVLQKKEVSIVSYEDCNSDSQFAGFIDNRTMICAGNRNDGSDICFGDSGGPLCWMDGGRCIQIGIVSFGTTCATGDRAAVYSRVSSAYHWIKRQICDLSDNPPHDCASPITTQKPAATASASSIDDSDTAYVEPSAASIDDISGRHNSNIPSERPSIIPSDQPNDVPSTLSSQPSSLLSNETLTSPLSDEDVHVASSTIMPISLQTPTPTLEPPTKVSQSLNPNNIRTEYILLHDSISSELPTEVRSNVVDDSPSPTAEYKQRLFALAREDVTRMKERLMTSSTYFKDPLTTKSSNFPDIQHLNHILLPDRSVSVSLTDHVSTIKDDKAPQNRKLQENSETFIFPAVSPLDGTDVSEQRFLESASPRLSSDGGLPDGIHLFLWVDYPPNRILGPCEGNCHVDADCEKGLSCFSKPNGVPMEVPGCIGIDSSDSGFCVFQGLNLGFLSAITPDGVNLFTWKDNPPNQLLGPCEGDCDHDSDCKAGLYCFHKAPGQVVDVPGCKGTDTSNTDFCVRKTTRMPTRQPTRRPTQIPTNQPARKPTPMPTRQPTSRPTPMPTRQPTRKPTPIPTKQPTRRPTPTPTKQPTRRPTLNPASRLPELYVFPENPPKDSDMPLQLCQGDCDRDSDCAEGLICYTRKENDNTIPWCSGLSFSRTDFCTYPQVSRPPTSPPTKVPTRFPTSQPTRLPTKAPTHPPFHGPTKSPTKRPTIAPTLHPTPRPTGPKVSVTLSIYFDPWPEETSWTIKTMDGKVVASVPPGTYTAPMDQVHVTIMVNEGVSYKLTVADTAGDGIAGIGKLFEVTLTRRPEIILLQGEGSFAERHVETFYVPRKEELPTASPTLSPAPTMVSVAVFLTIHFDSWNQETAWQIVAQENPNQIWAEAGFDTYRAGATVTEKILLPPRRSYIFIIKDFFEDGIDGGSYKMVAANGKILFEGDGNFGAERQHQFAL